MQGIPLKMLNAAVVSLTLCGASQAEGLMDTLKRGVESTTDVLDKGAGIVADSIDSTAELLSNEATPEETRARLDAMSAEILDRLLSESDDARTLYPLSAGYAAFDTRRVSVFPVSAAYGRGVTVSLAGERTYMNMSTGGVGLSFGIGGFETQFVILFETPQDLDDFVNTGVDAQTDWGYMAGDDAWSDTVRFINGRSYFILSKNGWRVNANAEGTTFWKSPELN